MIVAMVKVDATSKISYSASIGPELHTFVRERLRQIDTKRFVSLFRDAIYERPLVVIIIPGSKLLQWILKTQIQIISFPTVTMII
jgi:hypothetical protein